MMNEEEQILMAEALMMRKGYSCWECSVALEDGSDHADDCKYKVIEDKAKELAKTLRG